MPLIEAIRTHVFAAERIRADRTEPVLARGKTRVGRLWTCVHDGHLAGAIRRRCSSSTLWIAAPGPRLCAVNAGGAYAGLNRLYDTQREPAPIIEAARWAMSGAISSSLLGTNAPIAVDAAERIDALFAIERRSVA